MNGLNMKPAGAERKTFVQTMIHKQYDDNDFNYFDYDEEDDDFNYVNDIQHPQTNIAVAKSSRLPLKRESKSLINFKDLKENVDFDDADVDEQDRDTKKKLPKTFETTKLKEEMVDFKQAIIHENVNKIKQIIAKPDFDINLTFTNGWSPLMYAVVVGSLETTELFVKQKADVNYGSDKTSVLMCACACKRVSDENVLNIVRMLVANGATVETYDKYCITPLMFASREGNLNVLIFLLSVGADVNRQDENGWTALTHACYRGQIKCVYELLKSKANTNLQTFDRLYPIELAISNGYIRIKNLIENYLNNNTLDEIDETELKLDKMDKNQFEELQSFLKSLSLTSYLDLFMKNGVTLKSLLSSTANDLNEIGLRDPQIQYTILNEIKSFHKLNWKPSSVISVKNRARFNCQEATAIIANLSRHFDFIETTLKCLNTEISDVNSEFFQEYPHLNNDLREKANEAFKNSDKLCIQLRKFTEIVSKKLNNQNDKPKQEINSIEIIEKPSVKKRLFGVLLATSGLLALITLNLYKK